jgi:hypothetical protein
MLRLRITAEENYVYVIKTQPKNSLLNGRLWNEISKYLSKIQQYSYNKIYL